MVAQSPPYALQNASHSAALFRQAAFSAFGEGGTLSPAELVVAAQSTPNMSVQVSAGRAWVLGTQVANASGQSWSTQAAYFGINDAPLSVTISAANATNPRIDVIYVAVNDSFYSGSLNTLVIGVATGIAAASPAVPSIPNNALALGRVAVAANATSIVSANITLTAGLSAPTLGDDTGWVTASSIGATAGTGFDISSVSVRRRSGQLFFSAAVSKSTWASGDTVLTFPAGWVPTKPVELEARAGTTYGILTLQPSGALQIFMANTTGALGTSFAVVGAPVVLG